MTARKFYKTEIKFEVLSPNPIPEEMSLENITSMCIYGEWSMGNSSHKETEINGKQAAQELINQGIAPAFFQLDHEGNHATDIH